ncbi:MAG: molybdenum cofactor guanylyltransferase [Elusimicrobiota bacterium]
MDCRGVNAIVLCGGKSSRMGFDKAFIKIDGKTLVERQVKFLIRRFRNIVLVTDSPGKYKIQGRVKVVADIVPGLGPLGGLYTGLKNSDSPYNFVAACDMPFISLDLAAYMAGSVKEDFQAVVPYHRNKYQPLCALYSRDCLGKIGEALAGGELKLARLLSQFKVRKILKKELFRFGDPDVFFRNINTPRDLRLLKSFEH